MTEKGEPDRTEEHRPTLGETSHTNPYTDETFGDTQTFGRGRFVAADGGADPERESEPEAESQPEGTAMRDVDHTPPDESDGAAPVYERGNEGRSGEDEDVR
ncbi:hypothetical protein ACFQE8_02155 [Salinirubellus sp. GCM10025818]|jgi:hypothetical protein|uniref:hypothetical protein n=1 Tax=Salinirubellus TaxID=2162630 RepID=UPI0030D59CCA